MQGHDFFCEVDRDYIGMYLGKSVFAVSSICPVADLPLASPCAIHRESLQLIRVEPRSIYFLSLPWNYSGLRELGIGL